MADCWRGVSEIVTAGINLNPRVGAMGNWTHYWFDNSLGTPFSCKGDQVQRRHPTAHHRHVVGVLDPAAARVLSLGSARRRSRCAELPCQALGTPGAPDGRRVPPSEVQRLTRPR